MRSLEEVPGAWGNTGRSKEKLKFGAEKSDVPSKNAGNWIQNGRMGKKIDGGTGKNVGEPSKKPQKLGSKRGKTRKKVGFAGQKTRAIPRKIARNRVRNGEKREKRRFWSEKGGVGEWRKNGLYCQFCNAIKWQNGCK